MKYASLAAFWSAGLLPLRLGLTGLDERDGEEESVREIVLVVVRAEARDFRRPWAEVGRLPVGPTLLRWDVKSSDGAEGDQGLSCRSASTYISSQTRRAPIHLEGPNLFPILCRCPAMILIMD